MPSCSSSATVYCNSTKELGPPAFYPMNQLLIFIENAGCNYIWMENWLQTQQISNEFLRYTSTLEAQVTINCQVAKKHGVTEDAKPKKTPLKMPEAVSVLLK